MCLMKALKLNSKSNNNIHCVCHQVRKELEAITPQSFARAGQIPSV